MRDHEQGDDAELVAGHGSAKQAESSDPLELRGTSVPGGDPEFLARCLVEEFAGMGHGPDEILELFRRPEYLAPHAYWRDVGDEAVRDLIDEVVARCGVLRVTEEHPGPEADSCPQQREADGAPARSAPPGASTPSAGAAPASARSGPLHQIEPPRGESP